MDSAALQEKPFRSFNQTIKYCKKTDEANYSKMYQVRGADGFWGSPQKFQSVVETELLTQ